MNWMIVKTELRLMARERLFLAIAGVFLFLVLASGFIGWSTSSTVNHAYSLSVPLMQPGAPVAPNPFANVSHLSLQRNIGIYFFLIGSLLAIILGYSATLRDRTGGTSSLVLSRPVSKETYLVSKALAVGAALAVILLIAFFSSVIVSSILPELGLTLNQITRLVLFYAVSWIYLTTFGLLGLASGLLAKSYITALLIPAAFWILIGFVVPQVISGTEPVALLNPVTIATSDTPSTSSFFTVMSAAIGPFAFPEQYKQMSLSILEFQSTPVSFVSVLSVMGAFIAACVASRLVVRKYEPSERIAS